MLCFREEFLLHSSCYGFGEDSLTLLELGLVKSFRSSPDTSFSEEFFLHYSGCVVIFSEEFFLHYSGCVLVRSFSYTPGAGFSEAFLLLSSNWFLVRSFSYIPRASISEEFLLFRSFSGWFW